MAIYPYSFTLPPVNKQDIPSDGVVGEFLGISAGGVLDWLPVSGGGGSGDMLKSENLSGLADYAIARTNIGLGTASTPTFANLTLTSPSLSSSAPVTISQTWDQIGTAFTAFKVNATSTASAAGSLLLDLQVGTVSQFSVNKSGNITTTASAISSSASTFDIILGGLPIVGVGLQYFGLQANAALRWTSSGVDPTTAPSVALVRDDADNTLALRNGASVPQTFRVYNTFLGTTANEWFEIDWKVSAGTVRLFTMHGGTGVARNIDISAGATLFFGAGSGSPIKMYSGNVERWNISATGHFIAAADNQYNIGANGANRPQNIFVAQTVRANAFQLNSLSHIYGTVEGIIGLYNNSLSDFNRLQFGGATDAFPAVARDGAGIKFTGAAAGSTSWIKVPPVAVSALPLAATAGAGARAFVNDASSPTFGSAVTGGGAVLVPVYSTGSAWNVG